MIYENTIEDTRFYTGDGKTVECPDGHEHSISDLDKVGMDYRCPECFRVVDLSTSD